MTKLLAHKDDCAIVVNGPTSTHGYQALDGKGGIKEVQVPVPTACSCKAILVQVNLVVPDVNMRLATLATPSGCSCSHE